MAALHGRRAVGLKLPQRKHTRLAKHDYSMAGYYFVTICTDRRNPILAHAAHGLLQLTPAGEMARQCMIEVPIHVNGVAIDTYCVMPDHVHAIVTIKSVGPPYMAADRSKQLLSRAIQQYKAAVSRAVQVRPLWQTGFYDHVIRNDADLAETRKYIQNNPAALLSAHPDDCGGL